MKIFACLLILLLAAGKADPDLSAGKASFKTVPYRISMLGNLFISLTELFLGACTGSLSLLSAGTHTASILLITMMKPIGLHISRKRPDQEHPFGYGRVEYLIGLLISLLLIGSGLGLIYFWYDRLAGTQSLQPSLALWIVVLLIMVLKIMVHHLSPPAGTEVGTQTSTLVTVHHRYNFLASLGVLLVLSGASFNLEFLDPAIGLAITIFFFYLGINLGVKSSHHLIGTTPGKDLHDRIFKTVLAIDEVKGAHNLLVHDYGFRKAISIHIMIDGNLNVHEAHEIAARVEKILHRQNRCKAVVHLDPHHPLERTFPINGIG
ncbi:MAG: cation diffusion facilitator family transporter [Dethiobacteria bacterium]